MIVAVEERHTAVRLPSDLRSPTAPLPLANGLRQLAHWGLSLSPPEIFRYLYTGSDAHAGHTHGVADNAPNVALRLQ
jgi:hypothetical protein